MITSGILTQYKFLNVCFGINATKLGKSADVPTKKPKKLKFEKF